MSNGGRRSDSRMTWAFIVLWAMAFIASAFIISSGWTFPASFATRVIYTLLVLWFLANAYVWLSPTLRLNLIERRGPLLGFGFAFAAALLSSVGDGLTLGFVQGVGLFFWRLLLLSLPFALPFILKPTAYPHHLDLGVVAYALALPHLPGFSGDWITLPAVTHPGLFALTSAAESGGAALGVGTLSALALIGTYFYATRTWSAAPLDLRVRAGDLRHAGLTALFAVVGWSGGVAVTALTTADDVVGTLAHSVPTRDLFGLGGVAEVFTHLLMALGLAALFESVVFRGLIQSGWPYWLSRGTTSLKSGAVSVVGAVVAAILHATIGVYGLGGLVSLGFALGLTFAYRRVGRLLPTATGHAFALLILALLGAFFGRVG